MTTLINSSDSFEMFKYPKCVGRLICCDFDETYMPHSEYDKKHSGIVELEQFIDENNDKLSGVIGWISGSNIFSIIKKSKHYISKYPHFIAASLGTELYWIIDNKLCISEEWCNKIADSGFDKNNIVKIISELAIRGIVLNKQKDDFHGIFMESYYYYSNKDEHISVIENISSKYNVKAEISYCNPAAGDPQECYDIMFIPNCCGKKEVLMFIANNLNVPLRDTWAFGDSLNDYEMLIYAGNSFALANADPALKSRMNNSVLKYKYCYGIMEALKKI